MTPFLPVRHLLEYLRRRLVHHLNAGEIWQTPDLLGQGAVCPLYNLLKAFRICVAGHEANFITQDKRRDAEIRKSKTLLRMNGIRNWRLGNAKSFSVVLP